MNGHSGFAELVIGHALDALEPGEEQTLLTHLPGCTACRQLLDDVRGVAAQLAYDVEQHEPPAALLDAIRAEMVATARVPDSAPDFELAAISRGTRNPRLRRGRRGPALHHRGPGTPLLLRVAAAVALVAVVATGGYAVHERSQHGTAATALSKDQELIAQLGEPGSYTVPLASGGASTGTAVVDGSEVYLVADNLPLNDTRSSMYVLWAERSDGSLAAVTGFDVTHDGVTVVQGTLPSAASGTKAFGVTHEAGRTMPSVPGKSVLGVSTST